MHQDYKTFNDFLEEIRTSSLKASVKADVSRVISCFIYIMEKADYIQYAVDHQNEKETYANDPNHLNVNKDFKNHVLRDPNSTSFHLALHQPDGSLLNGQQWMQEMRRMMHQLEAVIKQLPTPALRLEFAEEFEYNDKTGCLDARIQPALNWAEIILLSPVRSLDFLMHRCHKHYPKNADIPFSQFAEQYLKTHDETQCIVEKKTVPITSELIKQYAIDVLGESDEKEEKNTSKDEVKEEPDQKSREAAYYTHIKNAKIFRGQQGMLQHHFANPEAAKAFLTWIHSQNILDPDKCKISHEKQGGKNSYIIRLSEEQLRMITTDLSEIPVLSKLTEKQIIKLASEIYYTAVAKKNIVSIISKHPQEDINAALVIPFTYRSNILAQAAEKIQLGAFIPLIQKASSAAINQALTMEDCYKWTPLHMAATCQPANAFIQLIRKASSEVINKVLTVESIQKWTPLHVAAYHQPSNAFIQLIQAASPEAISKTLSICCSKDGENGLCKIMRHQPVESLSTVINKVKTVPNALSAACLNNKILLAMLQAHSPETIADLFNSINDNALRYQLTHITNQAIYTLASYIIHEPSWQDGPILSRLLQLCQTKHQDPLISLLYKTWLAGIDLPSSVLKEARPFLEKYLDANNAEIRFEAMQINQIWKNLLESRAEKISSEEKTLSITCKSGKIIALDTISETDIDILWHEGLNSPLDYRRLKQTLPNHTITQIADDMRRAKLLYVGCLGPLDKTHYRELTQEQSRYLAVIEKGNALIKSINPKHWDDFRKQLRDYNYRADLRVSVDKDELKYKFVHRTGTIVKHQSHEKVKKNNIATKKTSATQLSKNLNTAVFGQHIYSTLVGVLLDTDFDFEISAGMPPDDKLKRRQYVLAHQPDNTWQLIYFDDNKNKYLLRSIQRVPGLQETLDTLPKNPLENLSESKKEQIKAIITQYDEKRMNKALFIRDTGTHVRGWVTKTLDESLKYENQMQNISYTDYNQFRDAVDKHPYKLNEVLRKFTWSSLRAIFIRHITKETIECARQYQRDVLNDFGMDLPITHYDPLLRQMQPLSMREQIDVINGYNMTQRNEETLKLEIVAKSEVLSRFENNQDPKVKQLIDNALAGKTTWQMTQKAIDEIFYQAILKKIEGIISQKTTWNVGFFGIPNTRPHVIQEIVNYITDANQGRCLYVDAYQKTIVMIDKANADKKQYLKNAEIVQFVETLRRELASGLMEHSGVIVSASAKTSGPQLNK
jgi:hypothetical protein